MKIGCQTYSWEMQLKQRPTTLWEMFDAIAEAGYDGVEFTNNTGGQWFSSPDRVHQELNERRLQLLAVAVASNGYTDPNCLEADLQLINLAVHFLQHFPGTVLTVTGAAHPDQTNWQRHLDQAIRFYQAVVKTATDANVPCAVHPHSHHGSLIQTEEQYAYLFEHLPREMGWCPDTGHIVGGGQDLLACLEKHADRIVYVHMKDMDSARQWQPMGKGIIDFPAMLAWLKKRRFSGWLVAEEESQLAWQDPIRANQINFAYIRRML